MVFLFEVSTIPGIINWNRDGCLIYLEWLEVYVPGCGYGRKLVYEFAKYVHKTFGRCRMNLDTIIGFEYYVKLGFRQHSVEDNEMSGLVQTIMRKSARMIVNTQKSAIQV